MYIYTHKNRTWVTRTFKTSTYLRNGTNDKSSLRSFKSGTFQIWFPPYQGHWDTDHTRWITRPYLMSRVIGVENQQKRRCRLFYWMSYSNVENVGHQNDPFSEMRKVSRGYRWENSGINSSEVKADRCDFRQKRWESPHAVDATTTKEGAHSTRPRQIRHVSFNNLPNYPSLSNHLIK